MDSWADYLAEGKSSESVVKTKKLSLITPQGPINTKILSFKKYSKEFD